MSDTFFFALLPYVTLVVFFGGTLLRAFRGHWVWSARGDFQWTTRSTGFFGRASIGPAALSLHWGIAILLVGHLVGLIGGAFGFLNWVAFFRWAGFLGGVLFLYGVLWAVVRRLWIPQLRAMSNTDDYITLLLLLTIAGLGLYQAALTQIFGVSFPAGAWIAGILRLQPNAELMAAVPLLNKLHIIFAQVFFIYFPFSKLAHISSFPFVYATRSFISVRTYWSLKK